MAKAKKAKVKKQSAKKSALSKKKSSAVKKAKSLAKKAKPMNLSSAAKTTVEKQMSFVKAENSSNKKIQWERFISPLDDRMIVSVLGSERITAGGLIIPDTAEVSGNRRGLVLAVGPGHRDKKGRIRPMDVTVGDKVLFPDYSGAKMEIQGQTVVIIRETDVLGVTE